MRCAVGQHGEANSQGQELAMIIYCNDFDNQMRNQTRPKDAVKDVTAWQDLFAASGIFANITEDVLPRATFSEKDIQALELEFRGAKQVRDDCTALVAKEPPEAVNDALKLAQWVIQNLPFLKSKKAELDAAKQLPGASLGTAMLGKAEANDLNVTNYLSAMFLDVDRYTKAVGSMNQQNNDLNDRWVELRNQHVKDVKQFQANMQTTELVFWASEEKRNCLPSAIGWTKQCEQQMGTGGR